MAAVILVPAPERSAVLLRQRRSICAPDNLLSTDLGDGLAAKRTAAHNYHRVVKNKRKEMNGIMTSDVDNASDYLVGVQVATYAPQVMPIINNEPVLAAIAQLGQELRQELRELRSTIFNSSTNDNEDNIIPPKRGQRPPPHDFPTTVLALKQIHGDLLNRIEDYYELGHQGTIPLRLKRVRRAFGVGVLIEIH